jgi:predicted dehydrogenase
MMRTYRYILVGLGEFGMRWATAFLPQARERGLAVPVAAVDVDPARFDAARAPLGLGRDDFFTSIDEALERRDCDFVIVVVPPSYHEAVVRSAVASARHILCEKPIAADLGACVRVSRMVDEAGIRMAVTMSHRFDQDKQSLQALIDSGSLGELNYVVIRFTANWRRFGDWGEFRHQMPDPLLVEGGIHQLDILRALTHSDAKTVYARSWNPRWGEYAGDSTALVTVDMKNGTHAFYEGAKANASTLNGWHNDYIRAECELGTAELDRRHLYVVTSGKDGMLSRREVPLLTARSTWGHHVLIEDFCRWLDGGPEPPTNHHDNLKACALLFAAVESGHTGQPVDVERFLKEAAAAAG